MELHLEKCYGQALNHSLLLTGIILHDVGKLKELYTDPTGNADYTPEGSFAWTFTDWM